MDIINVNFEKIKKTKSKDTQIQEIIDRISVVLKNEENTGLNKKIKKLDELLLTNP